MQTQDLNLKEILAEKGYRWTGPRKHILEVFMEHSYPLSAVAVSRQILHHKIDLASIYRTLHLLCKLGILAPVDQVEEGKRYELSDSYRSHHHYLICQHCGKMQDFEGCFAEIFEGKIPQTARFQVTRHEMRFYGVCEDCTCRETVTQTFNGSGDQS